MYLYIYSVQSIQSIAKSTGTAVTVEELFHHIPVRRMEYLKHIKTQYLKCVLLLQSYAIISTNVAFKVINYKGKLCTNIFSSSRSMYYI